MSIKALNWAYQQDVKGLAKFVLVTLAWHTNDNNQCWPGLKMIAKECGATRATVIVHIKTLEDLELITKQHRSDGRGYRRSSLYTLNINERIQESLPMNNQSQIIQRREITSQSMDIKPSKVKNLDGNIIESSLENTKEIISDCNNKSLASNNITEIFEHWKIIMEQPKAILDKNRKLLISKAIKLGYSIEQLKLAITGCSKSPFHMGDNQQKQMHNGLDLILRNAEKIEKFINIDSQNITNDTRNTERNMMAGVL